MEIIGDYSRYIAYIEVDKKGLAVSYSKAFLELFSISAEQLKEQAVDEVLRSEKLRELMESHRRKAVNEKGTVYSESLVPIVSKRKVIFWCIVEMVTGDGHEVLYFHDRTESYQAQMILESAMMLQSDLFIFFDTRECVLQCSEEAVRIFGFPNRLETFGLHCSTFFHNRLQEGVLSDMLQSLDEGKRYEGSSKIKYKGETKYYAIRAFNVMMKDKKAGLAVCLKETAKSEVYVSEEGASILQGGMSPYIIKTREEKFEPFLKMELSEVRRNLHKALCAYEYNRCQCIIEYLLQYDEEGKKETYGTVMGYLKAFCYDQAADVVKEMC